MSRTQVLASSVTLQLPRALDDDWSDDVGPTWRTLVARTSITCLQLDATDVRSVTARAVGLLTALHLIARQRGAAVRLRNWPAELEPLVTAAGLDVSTAAPGGDPPPPPA